MLVQNNKIRHVIRSACLCQLLYNVATSIYAMSIGKNKAHFLKIWGIRGWNDWSDEKDVLLKIVVVASLDRGKS